MMDLSFFRDKKVLVTGHTGFKGAWLSKVLINCGAKVTGYALEPDSDLNLFHLSKLESSMKSIIGDVRDLKHLREVFQEENPEIVFHLAAQPLVRESYKNPVYTYEVNVMGTVNVLECIRLTPSVRSFLNITTDKVYKNKEWEWGYRENEELNGYDPYSNSKSCSELVTSSFVNSFFINENISKKNVAISTARAGNVIGGGDFAADRIIPDCIRATLNNNSISVRNPNSTRPYQHVLEPIFAYLLIAKNQYEDISYASNYNVGPNEKDCIQTGHLVSLFCEKWNETILTNCAKWSSSTDIGPHEANFLKLDCSKLKSKMDWSPKWNIEKAIEKTIEWTKTFISNEDINECMNRQIKEYINTFY